MHDLIKLYLASLRSGDRPLAAALAHTLRSARPYADEADAALQELPRGPARWSAGAERALRRVLTRLESARL